MPPLALMWSHVELISLGLPTKAPKEGGVWWRSMRTKVHKPLKYKGLRSNNFVRGVTALNSFEIENHLFLQLSFLNCASTSQKRRNLRQYVREAMNNCPG